MVSFACVITQPPRSGLLAPKRSCCHLPDGLGRLAHAFDSHALADSVDRHQAQMIDPDRFDAVAGIGREGKRLLQDIEIIFPERQALFAKLGGKKIAREQTNQILAAFAIVGHHLDDAGRRLIGDRGLEHRTARAPVQGAVDELKEIVRAPLAINRRLDERTVRALKSRAVPVEDVDVDVVGLEAVTNCRLERIDRSRIPLQHEVRLAR